MAQQTPGSSSSQIPGQTMNPGQNAPLPAKIPTPSPAANPDEGEPAGTNQGPALMDPAGPQVSLQTSEAMFDMAAALNACGYNHGLEESNPVRKHVRDEVNQAMAASAEARDDRDKLCLYIDQHRLDNPARTLAQYVSLALYLSPPPELTPSVEEQDLPPDAVGVELMLPLLRRFVSDANLHFIWIENRPVYDEMVSQLHEPLTKMIVSTNYYLKMPASTSNGHRFLVVLEPLLSPEETNARVYGSQYVVVASPKDGQIYMRLVRHAYLHFMIEPLLYSRQDSMDRMIPILKAVQDSPLAFAFKSDIVALTVESLIKAIEARTLDTGVKVVEVPAGLTHSASEPYLEARIASLEKIAALRQQLVNHDMAQGFVLTQYFYNQLITFEKLPESMDQAIGPMVYGMDVSAQIHVARNVDFDTQGEADLMSRVPPPPPSGLDLAELDLVKGNVASAGAIAQKVVDSHSGDIGRANFILARVDLMNGKINDAMTAFQQAATNSKDPRTIAWSHIYLGRIQDVEGNRDQAVAQYKAALAARDGQPDTRNAAESGLKKPFSLPSQQSSDQTQAAAPPASPAPTPGPQ